jgi:nitroreductase
VLERQEVTGRAGADRARLATVAAERETNFMDHRRLSMPLGEAMFTQRSIRRFRPDPIPLDDVRLILEAAVRAPNGGNQQIARFLVVEDRATIREFGALYREAWWAKRHDEGFHTRDELPDHYHAAAGLADAMAEVPCVVFAFALHDGPANSVIPAVQNLMLAARAIGIGSVPTTLHPSVMARFYAMFDVPSDVGFHFCVPLGRPRGNFGPTARKPTSETTFLNRWNASVPWE